MTGAGEGKSGTTVRVALPYHLRTLANIPGAEVSLDLQRPVTAQRILDALEARYPMLGGTIREHGSGERRAFMRFFACEEDWSHQPMDAELPEDVASGKEPLIVLGAIAGGAVDSEQWTVGSEQ